MHIRSGEPAFTFDENLEILSCNEAAELPSSIVERVNALFPTTASSSTNVAGD